MKAQLFGIALAALVGLAFTGTEMACSSSSSGGGAVICLSSDMSQCTTLPPDQICPGMTTTPSSCPSSNQLGCCTVTAIGSKGENVTVTTCFYCASTLASTGSASTSQSKCTDGNGEWTAGDVSTCGDGAGGSSSGAGDAAAD
jgi:hypothetical protein